MTMPILLSQSLVSLQVSNTIALLLVWHSPRPLHRLLFQAEFSLGWWSQWFVSEFHFIETSRHLSGRCPNFLRWKSCSHCWARSEQEPIFELGGVELRCAVVNTGLAEWFLYQIGLMRRCPFSGHAEKKSMSFGTLKVLHSGTFDSCMLRWKRKTIWLQIWCSGN